MRILTQKVRNRIDSIDTPTQRWGRASKHSACYRGRERVGKHSLVRYFYVCKPENICDLLWIAEALSPTGYEAGYYIALSSAFYAARGARKVNRVKRVREALFKVMTAHGIGIPVELL